MPNATDRPPDRQHCRHRQRERDLPRRATPRSFVSLEGADHLLTEKNQAARAARIISAWADPYL